MKLGVVMAWGVTLLCAVAARAEDAQAVFDKLYSARIQEAIKTPATNDNVVLARELLDAVALAEKQDAFITLLCNKAAELAFADPASMDIVVEAQQLLAKQVAAQAGAAAEALLEYRKLHYQRTAGQAKIEAAGALIGEYVASSDRAVSVRNFVEASEKIEAAVVVATAMRLAILPELRVRQEQLNERKAVWQKVLNFQQMLTRQPDATPARNELMKLLTFEFNAPDEAVKYASADADATLRELTPLAAQAIADVDIAACEKLAAWYGENSANVSKTAVPVCLDRAIAYQERHAGQPTLAGLAKTQAELQLKQWRTARARFGGNAPLVTSSFNVPHKVGLIKQQKIEGAVQSLQFPPTGSIVLAAGGHQLWVWNAATDKVRTTRVPMPLADAVFAPDGRRVFFGGPDGNTDFDTRLWDLEADRQVGEPLGGPGKLLNVFYDGEFAAAVISTREAVRIRSLGARRPEMVLPVPAPALEATFSADLSRGFLLIEGRKILPCQPRAGKVSEAVDLKFEAKYMTISANGRILFLMNHGEARGFELATGKALPMIKWPEEGCKMVQASMSADGRRVVLSAFNSGNAYVFEVLTGKQIAVLSTKAKKSYGSVSAISPDGRFALSFAAGEGVVQLWGLPVP